MSECYSTYAETAEAVRQGLEEAYEGRTVDLGDFRQHLDEQ